MESEQVESSRGYLVLYVEALKRVQETMEQWSGSGSGGRCKMKMAKTYSILERQKSCPTTTGWGIKVMEIPVIVKANFNQEKQVR